MRKQNYKEVLICSCRGENTIDSVSLIRTDNIVKYLCRFVLDKITELEEQGESDEFVTTPTHHFGDRVYDIGLYEEGFVLFLEEESEYYKKVDSFDNWTTQEYKEWLKFLNELYN